MKKKLALILTALFAAALFIACGKTEETVATKEVKVVVPDGIPAIASAKLIKENEEVKKGYNIEYSIELAPENIVSEVLKGEADIAIVPSNVAATQYNKNSGFCIAGTVGWGSMYLVSTDGEKKIEELKNQEVYNIGKGLTPDLIVRSLLKDNNVNADTDVNFSYVSGVTELAPLVIAGKTKYAVMPEPAVSQVLAKNNKAKIIANLNEEWKKINSSEYGYPQSTVIVKKELIKEDKEFVEKFLNKLKESCDFAAEKNSELPDYCQTIGVLTNKSVILTSMERANINYTPIKDCYEEYNTYFNKLKELDASTIGGKVPDEEIFMEK